MVSPPPPTSPVDDNVEELFWSQSRTTILVYPSNARKFVSLLQHHKYPKSTWNSGGTTKIWKNAVEPVKQLSLLLESSTEPMIHNTLDYFLRLMYEKLETSPKRHIVACAMSNAFVNTFRKKLLMLLDDVEQDIHL